MNNITCNPNSGVCEISLDVDMEKFTYQAPEIGEKVLIEYFTDPACPACFAMEPALRELEEKYGDHIEIKNIMGGMSEKYELDKKAQKETADNWRSLGEMFNMPMSGKIMESDDYLSSTYPASLAYIAAKKQDLKKADQFLRKMRSALFALDLNIDKEEVLMDLASQVGLDTEQLLIDFYNVETLDLLEYEIFYTRVNGVSGFPSLILYGKNKPSMIIRGVREFRDLEEALKKFIDVKPKTVDYTVDEVFNKYDLLSSREVSELVNVYFVDDMRKELEEVSYLERIDVDNGCYWRKVSES